MNRFRSPLNHASLDREAIGFLYRINKPLSGANQLLPTFFRNGELIFELFKHSVSFAQSFYTRLQIKYILSLFILLTRSFVEFFDSRVPFGLGLNVLRLDLVILPRQLVEVRLDFLHLTDQTAVFVSRSVDRIGGLLELRFVQRDIVAAFRDPISSGLGISTHHVELVPRVDHGGFLIGRLFLDLKCAFIPKLPLLFEFPQLVPSVINLAFAKRHSPLQRLDTISQT